MFESLQERLANSFAALRGKGRLSEKDIEQTCSEIRTALLEADVSLVVVESLIATIRERSLEITLSAGLNPSQQIITVIYEELVSILGGSARRITLAKRPSSCILIVNISDVIPVVERCRDR